MQHARNLQSCSLHIRFRLGVYRRNLTVWCVVSEQRHRPFHIISQRSIDLRVGGTSSLATEFRLHRPADWTDRALYIPGPSLLVEFEYGGIHWLDLRASRRSLLNLDDRPDRNRVLLGPMFPQRSMYSSFNQDNFLFSGVAVIWHFTGKHSLRFPLVNLFRFHWGSVAGGAFLLHALYPLDLLYDLCKPSPHSSLRAVCCCCERLLDLARSEAMALVNMLAMPYCNAARLCEQIVYYSSYT